MGLSFTWRSCGAVLIAGLIACRHTPPTAGTDAAYVLDSTRAHARAIEAIDRFEAVARLVTDSGGGCRPVPGRPPCFAGRVIPLGWKTRDLLPRDSVEPARNRALAVLDEVLADMPGDAVLQGQRVDLLVMGERFRDAEAAARACRSEPWQCAMLGMYALHSGGRFVEAEAVLDSALALMPPDLRCTWAPLWFVLAGPARDRWLELPCSERSAFAARVWWLSDPSHLIPGNERRTEHYARIIRFRLWLQWNRDLRNRSTRRFARSREANADTLLHRPIPEASSAPMVTSPALQEMVAARGWYDTWWTVPVATIAPHCVHRAWALVGELPYSSVLTLLNGWVGDPVWYRPDGALQPDVRCIAVWRTAGGYQFVPRPPAVLDPFNADPADWQPDGWRREGREEFLPGYGPFATLTEHQAAFFRDTARASPVRADAARLVVVVGGLDRDPMLAALGRRQGMDARWEVGFMVTDTFPARVGDSTNVRRSAAPLSPQYRWNLPVSWRPQVISMEALGPQRVGVARLRAGVTPPAMPVQRITISDVLFFEPDTAHAGTEQPRTLTSALSRALSTSTIDPARPLGLFWETYGLAAGDTATVTLTVARDQGGLLERLGQAFRLIDAPGGAAVRYAMRADGPAAPAYGHSLALAFGEFPAGGYTVTVTITVPGQQPVNVQRRIAVQ